MPLSASTETLPLPLWTWTEMEPESRIELCSPLFITAANLFAPLFLPFADCVDRSSPTSSAAKHSAAAEIANRPPDSSTRLTNPLLSP